MIIQNPWAVTKNLCPAQKKALILNVIIGNLCTLASSTFAGTLMAWMVRGGQAMVNLEHTIAGLGIFVVSLLVGDRDLFTKHFFIKVIIYRLTMGIGDIIPMFFDASNSVIFMYGLTICMYPLMNGYRANRQSLTWGQRKTSLDEKQAFALRIHPLEMAVVALGGIIGMTFVPSVTVMSISYTIITLSILVMDIIQYKALESLREERRHN